MKSSEHNLVTRRTIVGKLDRPSPASFFSWATYRLYEESGGSLEGCLVDEEAFLIYADDDFDALWWVLGVDERTSCNSVQGIYFTL